MFSLLKNYKFHRVLAPVAAGTTDQKTSGVNRENAQTILFCVGLGAIVSTGTVTIKAQGSDTDVDGDYVDLEGASFASADDQDSKLHLLEVVRPKYKFTRLYIDLGTANTTIDLVIAMVGNYPRTLPVTQPATVSSYGNLSVVSPAQS